MAAIPTYIYIGDYQLLGNGAEPTAQSGSAYLANLIPGLAPGAGSFTTGLLDDRLLSDVPNNTGTAGSPVHAYKPWWDGTAGDQVTVPTGSYATGGGLQVTVAGAGWTVDEHAGRKFYVDSQPTGANNFGPSFGSVWTIVSNTADTLTLSSAGVTKEGLPVASLSDNGFPILCHIGTGKWVRYQHVANRAVGPTQVDLAAGAGLLGTQGDCWFQLDIPGAWGSTVSLMQYLESLHGDATGFRFYKEAFVSGWRGMNNGAAWASFVARYDAAVAHASFGAGDTPDVRGIVLDFAHYVFSIVDPVQRASEIASYFADMAATIALIAAKFGSDVPVWIINPATSYRPDYPGAVYPTMVQDIRWANKLLADGATSDLRLIDKNFATVQVSEGSGLQEQYRSVDILETGHRVYQAILASQDITASIAPGTAVPTFLFLGDSQMVGQVDYQFVLNTQSPRLLGPNWQSGGSTSTVRPGQWVYNDDSGLIETYDVQANENVNPTSSVYFGPTCSALASLGAQWDEVLAVKVAAGGATLTEEARQHFISQGVSDVVTFDPGTTGQYGLWPTVQSLMADLFSRVYDQKQRVCDVRGAGIIIGDNDTSASTSAAAFEDKLRAFLGEVRQNFYTRTSGTMQIVLVKPPRHVDAGGQSELGAATYRTQVRAAIDAVAAGDSNTRVIDGDDYELQNEGVLDKSIHYTGLSSIKLGDDIAAALIDMLGSSADGPTIVIQNDGADAAEGSEEELDAPGETDGATTELVASAEQVAELQTALFDAPDIAAYTTATGASVTRRSVDEMLRLERANRAAANRRRGFRQSRVGFR